MKLEIEIRGRHGKKFQMGNCANQSAHCPCIFSVPSASLKPLRFFAFVNGSGNWHESAQFRMIVNNKNRTERSD